MDKRTEKFEEIVGPLKDKFVIVKVPDWKMKKIEWFIQEIIKEKMKEPLHQLNGTSEEKRWRTGLTGEAALEEYLNIDIIDWTVGNSQKYNHPDLKNFNIGIKNSIYGNFPLIYKNNKYSQIICCQLDYNTVMICGVASPDVLNIYQDDGLVLDWRAKYYGRKTGFYGFEYLEPIENLKKRISRI